MSRWLWTLLCISGVAGAQASLAEPFADGTWTLTRLSDARGSLNFEGQTVEKRAPTLTLTGTRFTTAEGTQVSGNTGCNTFAGRGIFTATTVRLGPLAATLRACPPPQGEIEARFLNVLSRVRGLSFSAGVLVLSTGTERLVFGNRVTALETSRLFATWRLVGAVGNDPPTLSFEAGGRVSGSTGCNRLMGTYTLAGATLRLGPLATTRRACPDEASRRQETEYLRQLASVRRYKVTGALLTLTLEDGTDLTFARPVNGN